jgi:hypothetical protein
MRVTLSRRVVPASRMRVTPSRRAVSASRMRVTPSRRVVPASRMRVTPSRRVVPASRAAWQLRARRQRFPSWSKFTFSAETPCESLEFSLFLLLSKSRSADTLARLGRPRRTTGFARRRAALRRPHVRSGFIDRVFRSMRRKHSKGRFSNIRAASPPCVSSEDGSLTSFSLASVGVSSGSCGSATTRASVSGLPRERCRRTHEPRTRWSGFPSPRSPSSNPDCRGPRSGF